VTVPTHPLLDTHIFEGDFEAYLASVGDVFVVHRGHDSHNTSYGVRVDGRPWFVKYTEQPEAMPYLESALRFHAAVQHPAIVPLVGWLRGLRGPRGLAIVHDWADGEILNDPLAPGSLPRHDPNSAQARFRALPVPEILAALDTIFDAHLAVAAADFVSVDFYDGSIIYDFVERTVQLCDLDSYRPGPYTLDCDRQFGSSRFMPPEEFQHGATIDQRTMVFTLGRTAFVFLSSGPRGEPDEDRWRASSELYAVAQTATQLDPRQRYTTVAEFVAAWRTSAVSPS